MRTTAWILAAALLTAMGCASGKSFVDPIAKVTSVRVAEQTAEGARVEVTLTLENPNDVALPLKNTRFRMVVDGAEAFVFDDPSDRTLPSNGGQTLVLPAAFATDGKAAQGADYQVRGSVTYNPPGTFRRLLTEFEVPLPTVDFSSSGQLP